MSVGWGCVDGVEVELWGECYNIQTTIEIDLYNDNLYGEIPDEIGQLTNLVEINLGRNNFSGVIPESIGNLINLEKLYLHVNDFSGQIPSSIINLSNIDRIYLYENNLTGTLPNITSDNLPLLDRLYIQENSLSGEIPNDICYINTIQIYNNNFCPFYPSCIFDVGEQNTSECETPTCEDGFFQDESGCYNPVDLEFLQTFIDLNQTLSGLSPIEVGLQTWTGGYLTGLRIINQGIRIIPTEISNLSQLIYLELNNNNIMSLPNSICELINLETLDLSFNEITSEIPECINQLTNLEFLKLENNYFEGIIPDSFCDLGIIPNGTYLRLNDNYFCPPYPDCIDSQSSVFQPQLDSTCPCSEIDGYTEIWGECFKDIDLIYFDRTYEGISSEIPNEICNFINLKQLGLLL